MDAATYRAHLIAGQVHGQDATCGLKIGHTTEEKAERLAAKTNDRRLEAYPCIFCMNWHIGPKMTERENKRFSTWATTGRDPGE